MLDEQQAKYFELHSKTEECREQFLKALKVASETITAIRGDLIEIIPGYSGIRKHGKVTSVGLADWPTAERLMELHKEFQASRAAQQEVLNGLTEAQRKYLPPIGPASVGY